MTLFGWALSPGKQIERSEIAVLRKELEVEHGRLATNLRTSRAQLLQIKRLQTDMDVDLLLTGYDALLAMVDREDFTVMPLERIPVVVSQVTQRLERLGRLLREAQSAAKRNAMVLH
ncbi:MAG: hypothetical protein GC190_17645 [Alphaproteobacteria bacterium]|nr:hypothetical protein [Alphaproteobacteria bacterium]